MIINCIKWNILKFGILNLKSKSYNQNQNKTFADIYKTLHQTNLIRIMRKLLFLDD